MGMGTVKESLKQQESSQICKDLMHFSQSHLWYGQGCQYKAEAQRHMHIYKPQGPPMNQENLV